MMLYWAAWRFGGPRFFFFHTFTVHTRVGRVKRHERRVRRGFWFLQCIDFFHSPTILAPVPPRRPCDDKYKHIWRTTTTSCCSAHVKAGRRIASYPLRLPGWLPNASTFDWYCLRAAPLPWASMRVHSSPRCLPTRMHWCASTCSAFSTREISRAVGFQKAQRLRC
jgi:hypothetical protein